MAYNKSQIDRIGNLLIYITGKLGPIPKTKLLKLIYVLEEESVLKTGLQFTDLNYQFWPKGPVATFVNKQIDKEKDPLIQYINIEKRGEVRKISPKKAFSDDEFSDFDFQLMNEVIEKYGHLNANQLVEYTHRNGSPWKILHEEFGDNPPADKKQIDISSILNETSISNEMKDSVDQFKYFQEYLKSE